MEYPLEIATTLDDLMRFEYLVGTQAILPRRTVYSILTGRHAAHMRGRGLDFEEDRLYVAGDDIRNIDWRVTARMGETYSKVFNEEKERPTFTLVDQSSVMFFGSQRFVKSVTAAQLAALAGFYTLKRGDRFGGLVFGDNDYDFLAPKRSKALLQHFLQLVVNRNQELPKREVLKPNADLMNEMLQRTRTSITHDFVVSIIGDLSNLNDEGKHQIFSMANNNDVILIHVEDPMDAQLPEGRLVLGDGTRQIVWNNKKGEWGEKFNSSYANWKSNFIEECSKYGIGVSFMSTAIPIEEQIVKKIGQRM